MALSIKSSVKIPQSYSLLTALPNLQRPGGLSSNFFLSQRGVCVCARARVRARGPRCVCMFVCASMRVCASMLVCVCDGYPSLAQGGDGSYTAAHLPGGPSAEQGAGVPASGACPKRAGEVAGFEPSGPLVKRL